jgi:hypothetical protein
VEYKTMRNGRIFVLIGIVALLMLPACSSGTDEPAGPEDAVKSFYRHLNDGDYDTVMGLYSAEVRAVLDDPESSSADAFRSWAEQHTHDGSIKNVEILKSEAVETGTFVEYRLDFDDGTSWSGNVTLTEEDGAWKMGFVG